MEQEIEQGKTVVVVKEKRENGGKGKRRKMNKTMEAALKLRGSLIVMDSKLFLE